MGPARVQGVLALGILMLTLVGCANTRHLQRAGELNRPAGTPQVLLMPVDLVLYELTAGGLHESNVLWTNQGKASAIAALEEFMRARGVRLLRYREPSTRMQVESEHVQLVKLHQAVSQTILRYKYQTDRELPTKSETVDWSLGEGTTILRQDYSEADYALFLYFGESFSSGARMAMMFLALLWGYLVPGGQTVGFASLVDLETGNVVWFNLSVGGFGDLP